MNFVERFTMVKMICPDFFSGRKKCLKQEWRCDTFFSKIQLFFLVDVTLSQHIVQTFKETSLKLYPLKTAPAYTYE